MKILQTGLFEWGVMELSKRWMSLVFLVLLSIAIYGLVSSYGLEVIIERIQSFRDYASNKPLIVSLIIFIWSFLLFTTFVPLGTITIILGGYLIGVEAGLIQFLSLLLSSVFLYIIFDANKHSHTVSDYTSNKDILAVFRSIERRPIMVVGLMRILPMIPSGACVFIANVLKIKLTDMLKATVLLGWMRPVFFAYVGSTSPELVLNLF